MLSMCQAYCFKVYMYLLLKYSISYNSYRFKKPKHTGPKSHGFRKRQDRDLRPRFESRDLALKSTPLDNRVRYLPHYPHTPLICISLAA